MGRCKRGAERKLGLPTSFPVEFLED